ncbi:MAG: class II aldolase/adducin family protein [Saprospiraceae bacterium]|nr:class II aldolase/adducin family protein [Saprospiraceae bacterium]
MDEGYIKYQADWEKTPPVAESAIEELNQWRNQLYKRGLLGVYPNGIGFGNVSQRWPTEEALFVISGSTTGQFSQLNALHYSLVTKVIPAQNFLYCRGPIIASSESMSHAAIYEQCPAVQAAFHVHHKGMWDFYYGTLPATAADIPYGTPEMAFAIQALVQQAANYEQKCFVMHGHEEGLFAFGESLEEAGKVLINLLDKWQNTQS